MRLSVRPTGDRCPDWLSAKKKRSAFSYQRSEEEAISRQPSAVSGAEKKQSGATSDQPSAISGQLSAERKRSCLMLKAKNGQ